CCAGPRGHHALEPRRLCGLLEEGRHVQSEARRPEPICRRHRRCPSLAPGASALCAGQRVGGAAIAPLTRSRARGGLMIPHCSLVTHAAVAIAAALGAGCGSASAAHQASVPANARAVASTVAPSAASGRAAYHLVKEWAPTPPYPTHDWEMSSV